MSDCCSPTPPDEIQVPDAIGLDFYSPNIEPMAVTSSGRRVKLTWQVSRYNYHATDGIRVRVLAKPYGVVKVDAAPGVINITVRKDPPIEAMAIMHLIQKNKHIKLAGNDKLRIERELPEPKDRAQMVRDVLRSLGQPRAEVVVA